VNQRLAIVNINKVFRKTAKGSKKGAGGGYRNQDRDSVCVCICVCVWVWVCLEHVKVCGKDSTRCYFILTPEMTAFRLLKMYSFVITFTKNSIRELENERKKIK
jgi:hypothetical protein